MIVGIYTKPAEGEPVTRHDSVMAEVDYGLEGDVYSRKWRDKGEKSPPRKQVTLTASEALVACQREFGLHVRPADCRRNLITVGVSLNDLVGKTFKVGDSVVLKGIDLCEPCAGLEKLTGIKGVVKALTHRAGLRAEIIAGGEIREGDVVLVD